MRRIAGPLFVILVSALACAQSSYADGSSIGTASAVAFGQQEFGNTITGRKWENENCDEGKRQEYESYWSLAVVVGDTITIDWEAQQPQTKLEVFPLGTTEFNFGKATPIAQQGLNNNGKNELTITDNIASGSMPLIVHNASCEGTNGPGPYSFTAYVIHALDVTIPRVAALHRDGVLVVGVHNPEGGAISGSPVSVELRVKAHGAWQTIGAATVVGTTATVHFKIPRHARHQPAVLRAVAHGVGYKTAASAHVKVRLL